MNALQGALGVRASFLVCMCVVSVCICAWEVHGLAGQLKTKQDAQLS